MQSNCGRHIDGLQTLVAILGISLGVVPLVRSALSGEPGRLYDWLLGETNRVFEYLAPLAVVVIAVVLIAVLDSSKRPTGD